MFGAELEVFNELHGERWMRTEKVEREKRRGVVGDVDDDDNEEKEGGR